MFLLADASKLNVYDSPLSTVMSFCPTIASQGLLVPAGMSAHSLPSVTAAGALPVLNHGSLPAAKSPLTTCCAEKGASDTLSTQNVQASLLPPTWKATCPLA